VTALASFDAVDQGLRGLGGSVDPVEIDHELRRRLAWLTQEEAVVVSRWYVQSTRPEAIAASLGRSIRHVYRVRASAIHRIVALGQAEEFASADVAEFL
jgi:FixJ family two-component response regulator